MGTTQNMGKGGRIFNVVECHFSSLGGRGGQEFSEGRKGASQWQDLLLTEGLGSNQC